MKWWKLAVIMVMVVVLAIGCGKKEQPQEQTKQVKKEQREDHGGSKMQHDQEKDQAAPAGDAPAPEKEKEVDPRGGKDKADAMGDARESKESTRDKSQDRGAKSGAKVVSLVGRPNVQGIKGAAPSRSGGDIQGFIEGKFGELAECFNANKPRGEKFGGTMELTVTVRSNGKTADISKGKTNWSGDGKRIEGCVTSAIGKWDFGRAKTDCAATFKLKFN